MAFSDKIVEWYRLNKRDLPWRAENEPYLIWLSEIILQQTRVDQGMPYYLKFSRELPTVKAFANASEDKILKLWQGLGYYSRARNMHYTAKDIVNNYSGKFPDTYEGLLKLKGVGEYTAAAIASFCYNLPHPVIDGNVYRVLSRYYGIETPIDSTEGKKQFKQLADEVMDKDNPGEYNQAIMEFGALHCTPQNPNCIECPIQNSCIAYASNTATNLPVKAKKAKQRRVFYNYMVIVNRDKTYIQKRDDKSIWKNMYEFPLIETNNEVDLNELLKHPTFELVIKDSNITVDKIIKLKHILSHRIIEATFYKIYAEPKHFTNISDIFEVSIGKLKTEYALPRLIDRYCNENLEKY